MRRDRVLGVIGTLVWDRILDRDGRSEPVEEWGGISYAVAALSASVPDGWKILPIVRIGRDLAEGGRRFLREIPGVDDSARRTERLSGGVLPWSWPELSPLTDLCDAIYVNFISGFEMDLGTAQALKVGYAGPTYADLHSLFLGLGLRGRRIPRPLDPWLPWLRCFDAVQMNEDEFTLLGGGGDPWRIAAEALDPDLKLITVTLGDRGAAYVTSADFEPDPMRWHNERRVAVARHARSGRAAVLGGPRVGDPTGCGDVWGATLFARLLAGDGLEAAMTEANRLAGLNVEHRGARGLHRHLAGRLSHVEEGA